VIKTGIHHVRAEKKEIPANLAGSGISWVKHIEHVQQEVLKYALSAFALHYTG
jgi:hypothetical protein